MILDRFRLDGQVAVVTGAGRGIGRAIALALAEAGADVVVASRTQAELDTLVAEVQACGRRGLAVVADMAVRTQAERLIAATIECFGQLDVLVNNAGIFQTWAPPEQVSEAEWDRVFDIDLKSAFLTSQLAGRHMLERRHGSIINIASIAGVIALPLTVSYTACKAGMMAMTQAMAIDWAQQQVRVNAIAPGFIATPAKARTPLGRFGDAEEVASAAVFLASSAASYVTGTTLLVDGGWTAQ
jgi:NAD(P)-dependent dehydrogenase (short-subunit alcohol dehydrogenase family)